MVELWPPTISFKTDWDTYSVVVLYAETVAA